MQRYSQALLAAAAVASFMLLAAAPVGAQEAQNLTIEGVRPGDIIAAANRGKPEEVGQATPTGMVSVPWEEINFGKPPEEVQDLAGQPVTVYDCDGQVVLVLEGDPVPEECDEDRVLAVIPWGSTEPVLLGSSGAAGLRGDGAPSGEAAVGEESAEDRILDRITRSAYARLSAGVSNMADHLDFDACEAWGVFLEDLDQQVPGAEGGCSITRSSFVWTVAVGTQLFDWLAVEVGYSSLGGTDVEATAAASTGGFEFSAVNTGYFDASAFHGGATASLPLSEVGASGVLGKLRAGVRIGFFGWNATSGSEQRVNNFDGTMTEDSFEQEDSGSSLYYGVEFRLPFRAAGLEGLPFDGGLTASYTAWPVESHENEGPVEAQFNSFNVGVRITALP